MGVVAVFVPGTMVMNPNWIDRDDLRKDFVVVEFWPESEELSFTTSSSARSEDIHRALIGDDLDGHNSCRRVEYGFDIPNAVRLEGGQDV